MTSRAAPMRVMLVALAMAGTALAAVPGVAQAQSSDDSRIRKVEAEVRALQRVVFPGGDGRFFQPENVTPSAAAPQTASGLPATTAVTDILIRLDALEGQVARLTAQTEENGNALSLLTRRLETVEAGLSAAREPAGVTPAPVAAIAAPAAAGTAAASAPAATPPSSGRLAAVSAITKPQSDDAGDDEYTYGFRLWDAKFYPEAQQQLALFVKNYPNHWRTTYARNLLGRAYLDDGKPRDAATWFVQNYQADKQGARAPDSLLYLSEAMIAIKETKRACIALSEFGETYPTLATGRLQGQYDADRAKVKCN